MVALWLLVEDDVAAVLREEELPHVGRHPRRRSHERGLPDGEDVLRVGPSEPPNVPKLNAIRCQASGYTCPLAHDSISHLLHLPS